MLAFLLGIDGGPENTGMPRDVFRVVLDLVMPSWDPLRREKTVAAAKDEGSAGNTKKVLSHGDAPIEFYF